MTMKKQKSEATIRDQDLSKVDVPDCYNVLVVLGNCFNFDKFQTAQEKFAINFKRTKKKNSMLSNVYLTEGYLKALVTGQKT